MFQFLPDTSKYSDKTTNHEGKHEVIPYVNTLRGNETNLKASNKLQNKQLLYPYKQGCFLWNCVKLEHKLHHKPFNKELFYHTF
jgi:hypothetical protein